MRKFICLIVLLIPGLVHAQAWSSLITDPTRAIDWTSAGIPGGIPTGRTQCGSTILASTFGNGASDAAPSIRSALTACSANTFVLLGTGTFRINSAVVVPSNVTLRGNGANNTIINCFVTTNSCIYGGQNSGGGSDDPPSLANQTNITGGLTKGSTSITVASNTGMAVGGYLLISQLNDTYTHQGNSGFCNCDGGIGWAGTRNQGQIVEITSIGGTTIGITSGGVGASVNPGLYYAYNKTPVAVPFAAVTKFAGIENLQIFSENTGAQENFYFEKCMYCWVDGVESNYTDGNWVEIDWSFHDQISNSYMSNAQLHQPGTNDSNISIRTYSSGWLIQNNILERGHFPLMLEWGASGGVVGYNYIFGQFDITNFTNGGSTVVNPCSSLNVACTNPPAFNLHGLNPTFFLVEGNRGNMFQPDNTWGSGTWGTSFRNWWDGTTEICGNGNSGGEHRGTVNCSTGKFAFQVAYSYEVEAYHTSYNFINEVLGSTQQQSLVSTQTGTALGHQFQGTGACAAGVPSPCGSGSRGFGSSSGSLMFGYNSVSSGGGGANDTSAPLTTAVIHAVYSNINGSTTFKAGLPHSYPASFYLTSKPSWFGSEAYPFTGVDITGGTGPGGFANKNPAQICYESLGGTDGTGSPISGFNAATCYAAAGPTPGAFLSPSSLTFGNQLVGTTSAGQSILLTNTGTANTIVSNAIVSSGYTNTLTGTCPAAPFTLTPGSSCTFIITFTPSSATVFNGLLTVTDNVTGSPQTATLTGTGIFPAITWNVSSFNYGNVTTGSSTSNTFMLTNSGSATLNVALGITGASPAGTFYSITSTTCGTTLAAGANCLVTVNFSPTTAIGYTANLTETDSAHSLTSSVALTGAGVVNTFVSAPAPWVN